MIQSRIAVLQKLLKFCKNPAKPFHNVPSVNTCVKWALGPNGQNHGLPQQKTLTLAVNFITFLMNSLIMSVLLFFTFICRIFKFGNLYNTKIDVAFSLVAFLRAHSNFPEGEISRMWKETFFLIYLVFVAFRLRISCWEPIFATQFVIFLLLCCF